MRSVCKSIRLSSFAVIAVLLALSGPEQALARDSRECELLDKLQHLQSLNQRSVRKDGSPGAQTAYQQALRRLQSTLRTGGYPVSLQQIAENSVRLHMRVLAMRASGNTEGAAVQLQSAQWLANQRQITREIGVYACQPKPTILKPDAKLTVPGNRKVAVTQPASTGDAPGTSTQPVLKTPTLAGTIGLLAFMLAAGIGAAWFLLRRARRQKRRAIRHTCFIPAAMQAPLLCEGSEILDISRIGCKLRLRDVLDPTKPIDLFVGSLKIAATPKWANTHYVGVAFDTPLTEKQLEKLLTLSGATGGGSGSLVPSLPCHTENCRQTCPKYQQMQVEKARSEEGEKTGTGPQKT